MLQGKRGQILLELPGVKEHERVRDLLQRWPTSNSTEMYNLGEIASALQKAPTKRPKRTSTLLQPSQVQWRTPRRLRPAKDKDAISKLLADPKVRTYLPRQPQARLEQKAQKPEVTGGAKNILTLVALRTDIDTPKPAHRSPA